MSREKMPTVAFHVEPEVLRAIEDAVARGLYPNRSEAIRDALRKLLDKYRDTLKKLEEEEFNRRILPGRPRGPVYVEPVGEKKDRPIVVEPLD